MFQESNTYRPSKGLASRVGSWVTGGGAVEANGNIDSTELIVPSATLPYLSWIVLQLELERQHKLWKLLISELQPGKSKTVDQTLRSAAGVLKMPALGVHQLCLVRYAQMAVEIPLEHPLLPVIIQRFFSLYFCRPDNLEVGAESWAVGQLIMTSCSSLSNLLKQLALGWLDGINRLQNDHQQIGSSFFLTGAFFQSCCLWLDDVKLLEPNVYLPALGPKYNPARLVQLFQVRNNLFLRLPSPNCLCLAIMS